MCVCDEIPEFPIKLITSYVTVGDASIFLSPVHDVITATDTTAMCRKYDFVGIHSVNCSDGTHLLRVQYLYNLKDYSEYERE